MAACTATDLPLAWNVRTPETTSRSTALPLIDRVPERGFAAGTAAHDKG
jgi:hypothetical protein